MSTEQCGAMNRDGSRCQEPPAPESRFCQYHGRNGGPSPLLIWRGPREESAAASPSPGGVTTMAPPSPPAAPAVAPPPEERSGQPADAPPTEGLDWFLGLLQQAMTEMMASEASAPQKASAVARLGNLYLKAHRTAELAQQNKELRRHVAALEERLAAAEAATATLEERLAASVSLPAPGESPGPVAAGVGGDVGIEGGRRGVNEEASPILECRAAEATATESQAPPLRSRDMAQAQVAPADPA